MRRGRYFTGAIAVAAAALFWVPVSLAAATSQDVANYIKTHGTLAGSTFTAAQLAAYIQDTNAQQYGSPLGGPAPAGGAPNTTVVTAGVAGASKTITRNAAPAAAAQVRSAQVKSGSLPFTGAQLGVFAIVGLALLAMGLLLRSTARQKSHS